MPYVFPDLSENHRFLRTAAVCIALSNNTKAKE